ncbi:MAG TPA: transcription termination/antitermination factor NusG [Candidatus Aphodoplasma excrementigallinarum]|uniref:Transcription termination/antitermination protein NusG n=1 Tax=Candidatus Aphodoplasma excrementigallinarum TaxID=2840673 RepID=A0A9D1NI42_9FIRM|nr:transcription termination/antitermination factor NusG [Candidatus Aphodoplasma excrementigallinarum]
MADTAKWYVIHTYSGYENKVKTNIEKTVENRGMQDMIQEIRIPMEEVVEVKEKEDGTQERKAVSRKVLPGYVIVKMVMNDMTWFIVRNTRGVTSFVGPGSKPVPLTEEEVYELGIEKHVTEVNFAVGDSVKVASGPLDGFIGVVEEINEEKQKVRICVSMFGQDTPVELDFYQVETLD